MTDADHDALAEPSDGLCRPVTPFEVAHYQDHGWVKLERFIEPAVVGGILQIARGRMGEDGDSNEAYGRDVPYFNAEGGGGLHHPQMRSLMEACGQNAKLLMNRRRNPGIRYFTDVFAAKLPSSRATRNAGNGATGFHQDFISFGVDRSGGMTFWVALEAYGPDSGTMSFVGGSHRVGVLGSFSTGSGDLLDDLPELQDLPKSEAMHYQVGDVTVHSHLTVHGAGKNLTDTPRWAYLITVNPADALWTGAKLEAFDPSGMEPYEPFDDQRFPILAKPDH
jgi:hypothetical protein